MSIVLTYDVFCDGPGCQLWDENCTSGTRAEALRRAKRRGWKISGKMHLCPKCAALPELR